MFLLRIIRIIGVFNLNACWAQYSFAISVSMYQGNANRDRAEKIRVEGRRDDISVTDREEAGTKHTRVDLGPLPSWALDKYCRECAGIIAVKRFDAMAVDDINLVIRDPNCFERDTS